MRAMMRKYTIAVVQMDSTENREDNLERIKHMMMAAKLEGASLVALPEVMNRMSAQEGVDTSEPLDGPTVDFLRKSAKELKIWIHGGSIRENNPHGLPFNTSVVIDPHGDVAAVYRKIHLYDVDIPGKVSVLESQRNSAGNEIVDLISPLGHLGFTICYDLRFSELFRILALRGAQVIFVPANFATGTGKDHWEPLLRARAIENNCYIIASAQIGEKQHFKAFGNSMVIDPWGRILAHSEKEEGYILAQIDLDLVDSIREELPNLKNRRPDIYNLSCATDGFQEKSSGE